MQYVYQARWYHNVNMILINRAALAIISLYFVIKLSENFDKVRTQSLFNLQLAECLNQHIRSSCAQFGRSFCVYSAPAHKHEMLLCECPEEWRTKMDARPLALETVGSKHMIHLRIQLWKDISFHTLYHYSEVGSHELCTRLMPIMVDCF